MTQAAPIARGKAAGDVARRALKLLEEWDAQDSGAQAIPRQGGPKARRSRADSAQRTKDKELIGAAQARREKHAGQARRRCQEFEARRPRHRFAPPGTSPGDAQNDPDEI